MFNTFVDNSVIVNREPSLDSYLFENELDWSGLISEAKRELIRALKSHRKDVKKYCTPLTLQSEVTKTGTFTGNISSEDTVERFYWIVRITDLSDVFSFELEGTNDETTYHSIGYIITAHKGTYNLYFETPYLKYRVKIVNAGTAVTYTSFLVEDSFYLAHQYKSLELIYQSLRSEPGSIESVKAEEYKEKYEIEMDNMIASYDENLDGSIATDELVSKVSQSVIYK
jgi:hypothetical protein